MKREIFLDNNATTMPLPEVRDAMTAVLGEGFGNASSANLSGDRARRSISQARLSLSRLIGVDEANIMFASSGTEANNTILFSALSAMAGRSRIVTTSVEQPTVTIPFSSATTA